MAEVNPLWGVPGALGQLRALTMVHGRSACSVIAKKLEEWLENADDVPKELQNLHITGAVVRSKLRSSKDWLKVGKMRQGIVLLPINEACEPSVHFSIPSFNFFFDS